MLSTEKELETFRKVLRNYGLSQTEEDDYIELKKALLQADAMTKTELLRRAKRIKPVVRVRCDEFCHYEKIFDFEVSKDFLVFTTLCNISESYLLEFEGVGQIVTHFRRPLRATNLKKIGEFACYHHFHQDPDELCPCAEEVLRQIPAEFDLTAINAFEIVFDSQDPDILYDTLLDRYESLVILYSLDGGLPQQIKGQPIIYDGTRYSVHLN